MSSSGMRTILVPLDGSELAERALAPAQQLARERHAALLLLQVVPQRGPEGWGAQTADVEVAERYLARVADRLRRDDVTVLVEASAGTAAARIAEQADLWHSSLIVMSTHGRSGLSRFVHGSVADAVIRRATVPLLLIPARANAGGGVAGDCVIVPVDGSPFAENALGHGAELARDLAVPLVILHALSWMPSPALGLAPPDGELERWAERGYAYLDTLVEQVKRARVEAGGKLLVGPPARTIQECADAENAAAVVMATHGRTGLKRLAIGSVANDVLAQTTRPLMLVHPSAATADVLVPVENLNAPLLRTG